MNRIRELRDERGMTQLKLSIELGITQETISAYEVGKHYPSAQTLIQMAALFHTNIDYILGISDTRVLIKADALPEQEAQIINLFRGMSKAKQQKVIGYMQGLLE